MTEGQDATMSFYEFHRRSKKATLILKSLPTINNKVAIDNIGDKEMLDDFIKFRTSLETRGFFQPNYLHVSLRVFELFVYIYWPHGR